MITLENAISQLHRQGQGITFLVEGLDQDQARWKPDPENWSVLRVHSVNLGLRYSTLRLRTPSTSDSTSINSSSA